MITKKNFKKVLKKLGFEPDENDRWSRKYRDAEMAVDFKGKGKLIYPEEQGLIVNDKTTSNLKKKENFVVFECVCRLLEKGYLAEHIELEHRWPLGRTSKGGKADILIKGTPEDHAYYEYYGDVKDQRKPKRSKKTKHSRGKKDPTCEDTDLIIIECKTAGAEYNKAKERTLNDGGQLFSYWQQSTSVKWLALYSSDWEDGNGKDDGKIVLESNAIRAHDDKNILKSAEVDDGILTYENASTAEERFDVWCETYGRAWVHDPIFNPDSSAYRFWASPLTKGDLEDLEEENSVVNDFEKILRVNNVSDKENAFNRLIALFICKLVDELDTSDDKKILGFQYKQGSDTYEVLQDRLQGLHKEGMMKFMKEDITYVEQDYAEKLFKDYTGKTRKKAIDDLEKTIKKLKFYSNNDFAFKEVHNEDLFLQNSKVLVEVIRLFERYKIVYPTKQNLLGNLFEQLLNKGFKQNEGQFFTPNPITRFIWDSLPLEKYYKESGDLPKVIDYSCGAGHFLTEAVEAINTVANNPNNEWVKGKIFGIEKDYRLARVSKVSMYMNGAGGANIIFGDGLDNYPDKGIGAHSFDILVANPPYSVKGFKPHLNLKNNNFQLLDVDQESEDGGEIETLFMERISQLLRPKGIAAVILPVSSLDKDSPQTYVLARKLLLQNFYIRAIVSLGSKTFEATTTSTIILFLERYDEPPCRAKLMEDCCDEIMSGNDLSDWYDQKVLNEYLAYQEINEDDFRRFVAREMELQDIKAHPYFKIYAEAFKYSGESAAEGKEKFYDFALEAESEKIYYFSLVFEQQTLVITAPSDNKGQKDFLGYEWSDRKAKEGIHIITRGGKLYNDGTRFANGTLSSAIRSSFTGEKDDLPEDLQKYAKTYCLKDLLNFYSDKFNGMINLSIAKRRILQTKYETFKLSKICNHSSFPSIKANKIREKGNTPVVTQDKDRILKDKLARGYTDTDNPITDLPLILFGNHNGIFKYIDFPFVVGPNATLLKVCEKNVIPKFLYFYLFSLYQGNEGKYKSYAKYVDDITVPLPGREIQEEILSQCEAIEENFNKTRMEVETYLQKIVGVFEHFEIKWIEEEEEEETQA